MNFIFVLILWMSTTGSEGVMHVEKVELAGGAASVEQCASMPLAEAVKPLKDAHALILKGWVPQVICGVAIAPHTQKPPKGGYVMPEPEPPAWHDPNTETPL